MVLANVITVMMIVVGGGLAAFFWFDFRSAKVFGAAFPRNPKGGEEGQRLALLGIGAILSSQWLAFCNSLTTGAWRWKLKIMLSRDWDVNNATQAADTLRWLLDEGQRGGFDPLREIYEANSREAWPRALEAAGFTPQASNSLTRLDSAWGRLERARVVSRADLARSVAAWDLGRAVAIARAAHDCGYLSPSDAWNVINEAGAKAAAIYRDWREFAAGYLIGRCLWGGSRNLDEFIPLAKRYLEDKESPWRRIPLASLRQT
jgi:hypothetical protein